MEHSTNAAKIAGGACQSVRRQVNFYLAGRRRCLEAVAGTGHGPDQRIIEAFIEFAAQTMDMLVDHIVVGVEGVIPGTVEQHVAGHHLAAVAHEFFQQQCLAMLQRNHPALAHGGAGGAIQLQFAHLQLACRAAALLTGAQQGVKARQHFGKGIGFGQVIVAAGPQAFDLVGGGRLGAEHQYRHPQLLGAKGLDQGDAIEAGQAAIDHQHVMNALQGHAQPRIAVAGDIHHMTAFAQPAQQVGRRASVIFNHENAQGSVSARQN